MGPDQDGNAKSGSDRLRHGNEIQIGVIGAGWWATENHLPTLLSRSDIRVRALCGKGTADLEEIGRRFGITCLVEDHTLLPWDELDAVVVASPHVFHFEHASAALKRDLHVLCEKPLAVTTRDAVGLVQLAQNRSRVLMVPHGWQFLPGTANARSWIHEGRIGRVEHVAAWMASPSRGLFSGSPEPFRGALRRPDPLTYVGPSGGYAYGQLSHLFSLIFWLSGLVPLQVVAQTNPGPAGSDIYDAFVVRCREGQLVAASGAAAVPPPRRNHMEVRVYGSLGLVIVDLERDRIELHRDDGDDSSIPLESGAALYPAAKPVHAFCDLLLGRIKENLGDPVPSALGVAVIEAGLRSVRTGQTEEVDGSVEEAEREGLSLGFGRRTPGAP